MRNPLSSGAFRFALLIALVFAAGTAALLVVVERAVDGYVADAVADGVASETAILRAEAAGGGLAGLVRAVQLHQRAVKERDLRFLVVDAAGRRLAGALPLTAARVGWSDLAVADPGLNGPRRRTLLALGSRLGDGSRLVVAADTADVLALRRRLLWLTGAGGALVIALALIGGALVGSIFLRRLDLVNAAIARIMDGRLDERFPGIGMGPEFDRLSENLNLMLDRIDELVDGVRQVSVDVAHDLRTPLTRLRRRLEMMGDRRSADDAREIDGCLAQLDEVLAVFAALLRIAALESGAWVPDPRGVSLSRIVSDVAAAFVPSAEDGGRSLASDVLPGVTVAGDRELLGQATSNLIENALRHTPPGARVVVRLHRSGGDAMLIVEDDGPGVPDGERENVLLRFYRLDRSRTTPGAGLGLSLVATVVARHGGRVALEDGRPGLRVVVALPLIPEGAAVYDGRDDDRDGGSGR